MILIDICDIYFSVASAVTLSDHSVVHKLYISLYSGLYFINPVGQCFFSSNIFIDIFKPFTWLLIENKVQFLVLLIFYIEIFLLETIKTFCFEKETNEKLSPFTKKYLSFDIT